MKRVTAVFFLGVIMSFMSLVFISVAMRAKYKMSHSSRTVIEMDWEKLYPFADGHSGTVLVKQTLYEKLKEKFEDYTSVKMAGGMMIIEAARKYEELIGWNIASAAEYNPIVKLHDGFLTGLAESRDVSRSAEAAAGLADFCAENGIAFLYFSLPYKICISEDKDISGIIDFSNQNTDRFLHLISEAGVRHYDFRKLLHGDGMNHHDAFFVTDHHWKPESGLWAAKHMLEIFMDDLGWDTDPEILGTENFSYVVYPEWFLGSQGKKMTLSRTHPDDFTLIYPKFETSFHFEVPYYGMDLSGDFGVFYDMEHAASRNYYKLNPYGAYKYADQPLTHIHNLSADNSRKLLIIHDSMSNCVIPFLALSVGRIDEMDLRHFTGSLRSYILSERPDAVVVSYFADVPGRLESPGHSRVNLKFYDFR